MLAHADDVGRHHPLEAVDERLAEPVRQLRGPVAALQGVVAQHHQPLDVVGPAAVAHALQRGAQAAGGHGVGVQLDATSRAAACARAGRCAAGSRARSASTGARCTPASPAPAGRSPRRWRAAPSPARYAASAARTTSSGCSSPRLSGTDSSECAIAQSSVQHRVLVRAEVRQPVRRRSARSARRASSAVTANQRGPSRPTVGRSSASRSARTSVVDLVLRAAATAPATSSVGRAARRGLAVLVVVVPLAADRLAAVHQHVEPAALGAVEVLHPEGAAIARPLGELRAGQRERRRRQDLGDEPLLAQPLDELGGGVRGRLVHEHRPPDLLQRLAVGVGAQVAWRGRRAPRPGGASRTARGAASAGGTACGAARRVDSTSTTSRSRCSSVSTCGPSWSAKSHSGSAVMPKSRGTPADRPGPLEQSAPRRPGSGMPSSGSAEFAVHHRRPSSRGRLRRRLRAASSARWTGW